MKRITIFLLVLIAILFAQVPIETQTVEVVTPTTGKHLMLFSANMDSVQRGNIGKMFIENGIADSAAVADSISALLTRGYVRFTGDVQVDGALTIGTNNRYFEATTADKIYLSVPEFEVSGDFTAGGDIDITAGDIITTSASQSVKLGQNINNFTGSYNTVIGDYAGNLLSSGTANNLIGRSAGQKVTVGTKNTVNGTSAFKFGTGSANTIMGVQAGEGVSGASTYSYNVLFGYQAGEGLTTGSRNMFLGNQSGKNKTTQNDLFEVANWNQTKEQVLLEGNFADSTITNKGINLLDGYTGKSYIAYIDTTLWIASKYNDNYDIVWKLKNTDANDLWAVDSLCLKANANHNVSEDIKRASYKYLMGTQTTDNEGSPIALKSNNSATGGWMLGGHLQGAYKTGKTESVTVFADGMKVRSGWKGYAKSIKINVNDIGWNPSVDVLPVQNKILSQYTTYTIQDKTMELSRQIAFDSTVVVSNYYGLQHEGTVYDSLFVPHSAIASWYDIANSDSSGLIYNYPNVEKFLMKTADKSVVMQCWIDNKYGLPADTATYIYDNNHYTAQKVFQLTGGEKTYFNLIAKVSDSKKITIPEGNIIGFRGSYSWSDQSRHTDPAILASDYFVVNNEPTLYADVSRTANIEVPDIMSNTKVNAWYKDDTITAINEIPSRHLTITATDTGSVYLSENPSQGDLNIDGKIVMPLGGYFENDHADTIRVVENVFKAQGKLASQLGYFDIGSGFSITPTETTAGRTRTTIAGSDSIHFTKPIYFFGTDFNPNRYYMTSPTSTVIGEDAGQVNMSGDDNIFIGNSAGRFATTNTRNTYIGNETGRLNTGNDNVFVGYRNAYQASNAGIRNVFVGNEAGRRVSDTASNNIFIGYTSGANTTSPSNNTFLGYQSGFANTTGASNVYLGYEAGKTATATQSNKLIIANSATNDLITGDFDTGIVEVDSLMISGSMQDKYSRDSLYTFAAADTWYNIKFPQVYDTINEGFFTPNADSTGFVSTRLGVAHVDAMLHYLWTGAGGTQASAYQRVVKGRLGSTRVETKCGKNEFLRSNAVGDFRTLNSCSQFSVAIGDTIFIQSRVSDVDMILKYAPEGVFDSNTTANIIMEYRGK